MKRSLNLAFLVLCASFLLSSAWANAEKKSQPASNGVIQFTSSMTVQSLSDHSDSEMVQLPNGKMASVRTLRHLDAASQKMRAARPPAAAPLALRARPAASGTLVSSREQVLSALNSRSESDTIQLPSGRRITVAQLKLLQPTIEAGLGRKLADLAPEKNLTGPKVQVSSSNTDKNFWKDLLQGKGNEDKVLVSPHGKQVTVRDLKSYLGQSAHSKKGQINLQPKSPAATSGRKGGAQ